VRSAAVLGMSIALLAGISAADAGECPGNPDALGTSRVMAIDPADHTVLGTMQYHNSLPLADKEVVLTFDDGPLPPHTERVLEILAAECVKANYFIVGSMARAYPEMVRRIHKEGHVIGTHSENHPRYFHRLPAARMQHEVDQGIASTAAALGDHGAVAPFFRIPGLRRSDDVEELLISRGLVTWSADLPVDDWRHISPSEVLKRAMTRLDAKGKGIILLHDIQPATVAAMPELLRQLKAGGYKIVQVVARVPAIDDPTAPLALRASLKADDQVPPKETAAAGFAAAAPPKR
jgi:peptidoglycan/xylan/chitin deacetylase (PgdA/CDA1 family)